MQHESREASDAGERAGTWEAERGERLTRLVLCRSKLSPDGVPDVGVHRAQFDHWFDPTRLQKGGAAEEAPGARWSPSGCSAISRGSSPHERGACLAPACKLG
jgi:hypothetical protein